MAINEYKYFFKKYSAEIKITVAVAVAASIICIIASAVLQISNPRIVVDIAIGAVVVLLLLAVLFNLKRFLASILSKTNVQSFVHIDDLFQKDMYWDRSKHFTREKENLAETLASKTLPKVIQKICNEKPEVTTLNIILDSGTTITPIFQALMCEGIQSNKENLEIIIYTNNLAGIDEIRKINPAICRLDIRKFNLIGGKPLSPYRATTGELTQGFLTTMWEEQKRNAGKVVTLGILTANWFTCGVSMENISLCAKGEGHFGFKKDIAINSNYLILIAPLGKLLPLDDENILNKLVPKEPDQQYCSYTIPPDKKETTYLLTSFRPKNTLSPLSHTSIRLVDLKEEKSITNYTLSEECPNFEPEGDKYEVIVTELPHQYIRDNYRKVFHAELL